MLRSNEKQFQEGLVFKARRLFVSLNSRPRVIKKKKKATRGNVKRDVSTVTSTCAPRYKEALGRKGIENNLKRIIHRLSSSQYRRDMVGFLWTS